MRTEPRSKTSSWSEGDFWGHRSYQDSPFESDSDKPHQRRCGRWFHADIRLGETTREAVPSGGGGPTASVIRTSGNRPFLTLEIRSKRVGTSTRQDTVLIAAA